MELPSQVVARFRYVFIAAVLILLVLSLASLAAGIVKGVSLILSPADLKPGSGSLFLSYFIRAAFLYFLAVAFSTLFLGDLPVPQWMVVRNLFHFKIKVLTFVAVIIGLNFLRILADGDRTSADLLQAGGGIFLVLAGIFLVTRMGGPSGDEMLAREGNRPHGTPTGERRRNSERRKADRRKSEDGVWPEEARDGLKFERKTIPNGGDVEESGRREERVNGNVTVRPGPRRPPRRRSRSRKEGGR